MKKSHLFWNVAVFGLVLALVFPAFAADWPQWRGPNRDGKVTGFKVPEVWPKTLAKDWTVQVGFGDATPALVDGKLYVFTRQGDNEVNLCLDAATGKELWRDSYAAPGIESGPARSHPGPRCSPAVADGKLVTLNLNGVLSCLNAADGKLLWYKSPYEGVTPRFLTGSSPIIVGGAAIAQFGGGENGGIMAYGLTRGEEKWKWEGDGAEYASPVLMEAGGTTQIVTMTASKLVGVDVADGELLWEIPYAPERMSNNSATPIVDGQTVIYTAQNRGIHAAKIEKSGDGFTAKKVWSNEEIASKFSTPILKDGKIYGLTDRGNLFCVNAETGETVWTDPEGYDRTGFCAILDVGSVLLALPSNGELVAFKPGDAFKELARIKLSDTATYAHPIVDDNTIYLKDEQTLSMMTLN